MPQPTDNIYTTMMMVMHSQLMLPSAAGALSLPCSALSMWELFGLFMIIVWYMDIYRYIRGLIAIY